jgi:hypothetical protein
VRGWSSCSKVYRADTTDKIRACIITKQTDATLLLQFGCGDLVVIQLKLKPVNGTDRHVIMVSVNMPHDSRDLPIQEEVERLVAHVNNKGLELLLGCTANSNHEVWGSPNIY